jgi:hypothetical protein
MCACVCVLVIYSIGKFIYWLNRIYDFLDNSS